MKKYKATGCARFFVVMLFLAPLAYVGASYYNGQDPIQNIKDLINMDESSSSEKAVETPPVNTSDENSNDDDLKIIQGALDKAMEANEDLREENEEMKKTIEGLEAEITKLKAPEDGGE